MRALLFIATFSCRVLATENVSHYPVSSPGSNCTANFLEVDDPKTKDLGTQLVIKDRNGKVLFSDRSALFHTVVQHARWTDDGKYLVMTTINGGGHSPWHHPVYIFSLEERKIRWLDDSKAHPIISTEIWCQSPDTVIFVGHTFAHGISAPDDPLLMRYKVSALWPTLK